MYAPAPEPTPVNHRTAAILLVLVVLVWGFNWPVMKLALRDIGPISFAATRMVLGALCLFALAAWRGRLRLPSRPDWPIVVSVGLFQMGLYLLFVNIGLGFVPAGRSSILAYTTPIWVVPAAALLLGERLSGARLAGFALGMAGVAVMFNPLAFDWRDPDVLLGNGLLMAAALAWAVQIIQVKNHRWHGSPLDLAPWQFAVASAMLVPLAVLFEHDRPIELTGRLLAVVAYNGPLASAFCFWAVVSVNRALPAITTSLAMLGVPVAGVLFSVLLLGEPVSATNLAGLALIGAGLWVLAGADRRPRQAS
ncbi:DMT family transporter [Arenibaculum pallidiluteum]|uniref:DMT family transporter n=1 Tax=Arenibaculum pallidiluteum TaxID=2812559 RepID=UPI001F473C62|nr:DMT family transporter [Arenibaculum pallidiluteum]